MKPYISINLPTMRVGGLDVVFSSLENQTFKNFELVIIDNLYEYRKDIVKEKAKQCSFQVKHIPPAINKLPIQAYCSAINSGIVQSSGEVILFTTDYRYFMPEMLQRHAEFHQATGEYFGLGGGTRFVFPPPTKKDLPEFGGDWAKYLEAIKENKFQDYMWSIFENEFDNTTHDPSNLIEHDHLKLGWDPKIAKSPGEEIDPILIFLQNDSVKTKTVLAANGVNEVLEGHRGPPDIEFSHRLRSMFGFRWIGDSRSITYRITGGERVISKLQLTDNRDELYSVFEKYKNGSKDPVNDWSLAEAHAINQKEEV